MSIQGQGRQPVIIELRRKLLPPLQTCALAGPCNEQLASGTELTIVGRRMLTCVRTFIDSKVQAAAPDVDYSAVEGTPGGPQVPPFGDTIHAQTAFGIALTWEEVLELAKHPYVERVWTSAGLSVGTLPVGCPPNCSEPVVPPVCPTTTEPLDGKFSATSKAVWELSSGSNEVIIVVRGRGDVCPLPDCPGRECPERTRYLARLHEETLASQSCVRALIASIGGTASPEAFDIGNSFPATLTWPQIQTVATHPQVAVVDCASCVGSVPP